MSDRQVKISQPDWAGIPVYCGSDGGDFRALRSSILAKIHILEPEAIPIIKLTTDRWLKDLLDKSISPDVINSRITLLTKKINAKKQHP
uniref:hypothetical protein n=1 Tax=Pantoea sp. IMH TaxID=1267600 RepID=UPI0012678E8A|nr:hypothetical protein [Pantoea sp. IMH]